jgi:hypothetical protein
MSYLGRYCSIRGSKYVEYGHLDIFIFLASVFVYLERCKNALESISKMSVSSQYGIVALKTERAVRTNELRIFQHAIESKLSQLCKDHNFSYSLA